MSLLTEKNYSTITTPDGLTIIGPVYLGENGWEWRVYRDGGCLARVTDQPETNACSVLDWFRASQRSEGRWAEFD